MSKRIVIAAGGTGGHFYPGLVLAKTLRERGWEPLILVRAGDPGLPVLEKEGIPAAEVDVIGLPRSLSPRLFVFFWKLCGGFLLIRRLLRDFGPGVVVGMGGYLTFPALFAAALQGRARAVHESNAMLGMANALSVRLGAALFWGLPPAARTGTVTGTPIRPALWKPSPAGPARARLGLSENKTTVLVFGGSQGARGLNREVPAALKTAALASPDTLQVLHLSGAANVDDVRRAYDGGALEAKVLPYLHEMEDAYAAADLVICRSGASTLAELAAQRRPCVLVPLPTSAAGHQEVNARTLERAGAAVVMLEHDLPGYLAPLLADLLLSPRGKSDLSRMSEAYAKLALPNPERTAAALADAIEGIADEAANIGVQR